ncbi:hypothetical protein [Nostoc sp.]|uniref:hypothetical protein n=1 Tax=Nostoc sp. TaxID=1180 RepID=UPI002FF95BB9
MFSAPLWFNKSLLNRRGTESAQRKASDRIEQDVKTFGVLNNTHNTLMARRSHPFNPLQNAP